MNRPLKFLVIVVSLAWIFVVTSNYYIVHKPFGAENAFALVNALGDMLVALALLAVGAALGRRVLRGWQFDTPLQALVFQAGIGLGLLALAVFLLGLVIVNRFVFWTLLLAVAFLLRGDLGSIWRDLRELRLPIPTRFERVLAVFLTLALALAGITALMPPIAWDAQTYHLVIPKFAMERGQIAAPPDIVYFNFPSLGEMLFLAAMLLKGDIAAQVLHFNFFLLTLSAVFVFALRYFNTQVAWLACAILAAVPSLLTVATWAYVDLMLAFFAFIAFFALILALERTDTRWFALSGLFAGFAISIKYTAAIVPVALIFLLLLRRRFDLQRLFAFVAGSAIAAPYYIRNWIFVGNPVYPFGFGGKDWDAFRAEWFGRFGSGLLNDPIRLLLAPWDATIYGSEGAVGYAATIGPLLLMLIPLLLVANSKFRTPNPKIEVRITNHELRDMLIFSFIFYAFWLFGIAGSALLIQTRLLFPAFPAFAFLVAIAFERLDALDLPQFSLRRFARLVVGLICGLTALSYALAFASSGALTFLAGAQSREVYLARNLGSYYAAMKYINTSLPPDARVLFFWEPRSYYADRAAQPDAILDAWTHLRWQARDVDSIAAALRARGYTHVLLNRAGLEFMLQTGSDPITPDDVRALEEFVARHLQLVYGNTPLQIVMREGKPVVLNAADEPYAVYRLDTPR